MLFSVVIPCFNRAAFARNTIDSALRRELTDYEVIAVDDGSTDETPEVLAGYGDRIKTLRQNNKGPGAARNAGIKIANGDYVAFLDSDDLFFPWTLSTYAKVIQEHARPAIITGSPFIFENDREIVTAANREIEVEAFPDYFSSSDQWRWFSASSFVMRRDVLNSVGGFKEDRDAEDADLMLQLGAANGFVRVRAPETFGYREQAASLKKDRRYIYTGLSQILDSEANGCYPGGKKRKGERMEIISRAVRPAAIAAAHNGDLTTAFRLYSKTFSWNVRLGRMRFLILLPLLAFCSAMRRQRRAME